MIYSPKKTLYGNFKMYEVAKSRTADRLKIDNTPSDEDLERAEQTCIHIAQPVRDEFGPYSPNSWFRCEALERVICATSFLGWASRHGYNMQTQAEEAWVEYFSRKSHPRAESVDFEIVGVSNPVVYHWCKDNLPVYDQLIAEFMKIDDDDAGWIHGSYSEAHNRMQLIEIK